MEKDGVELYVKNGKVGVLVSPGYGAGWSTWEGREFAYNKSVIEFWLSHKDDKVFMDTVNNYGFGNIEESAAHKEAMEFFKSIGYGQPYMGGFKDLKLAFVAPGVPWRIREHDGWEELETFEDAGFIEF